MTTTLHAHVATAAADCDGPFYRDYVTTMTEDERTGEFGDIEFMNRVLTNHCSPYAISHGLRMTATEAGFEWKEDTDEGYRAGEVYWCRDECDEADYHQRDVYAEMMGY